MKKEPDDQWTIQQRKGEYQKVQGYKVLETNKNGELCFPIVPINSNSIVLILDQNGNIMKESNMREIKELYKNTDVFINSFYSENKPPASGVNFNLLKVDSIYRIAAGGSEWKNPHFKYAKYAQHFNKT